MRGGDHHDRVVDQHPRLSARPRSLLPRGQADRREDGAALRDGGAPHPLPGHLCAVRHRPAHRRLAHVAPAVPLAAAVEAPPMTRSEIYSLIDAERERQREKWTRAHAWGFGDCSSPQVDMAVKVAVLSEEVGEVARAVLDCNMGSDLRRELVQVAAVAVAWLEGL